MSCMDSEYSFISHWPFWKEKIAQSTLNADNLRQLPRVANAIQPQTYMQNAMSRIVTNLPGKHPNI